jgi:hypothetical protein
VLQNNRQELLQHNLMYSGMVKGMTYQQLIAAKVNTGVAQALKVAFPSPGAWCRLAGCLPQQQDGDMGLLDTHRRWSNNPDSAEGGAAPLQSTPSNLATAILHSCNMRVSTTALVSVPPCRLMRQA